jgi:hypothetical protein
MKKWSEFLSLRERCWPGYKSVPGKKAYSPGSCVKEDLRQWFDKDHPKGGWKRINSKGEAIGPCAREPGEPKPKCMSNEKRAKLSKKERASAVASKRKHDPNPERKGEPINVSNFGKGKISEDMENLDEKNVPTSPEKWAQAKAQAKAKFDVYPSAYANGWASKKYKEMGGGWKSVSEDTEMTEGAVPAQEKIITVKHKTSGKTLRISAAAAPKYRMQGYHYHPVNEAKEKTEYDYEGDMARGQLQSIINNAQRVHDMLKDNDNLPEWVQSKITLAEDYISTVANYLMSEIDEEVELEENITKMPTDKLQKHWDSHKDEQSPSPVFASKLKMVSKELAKRKAMKEQISEGIEVKKEYDDKKEAEHGVYHNGKKIGYVVHHKPSGTHTAYHSPRDDDDYGQIDDFHSHHHAVNQIRHSAGVGIKEETEQVMNEMDTYPHPDSKEGKALMKAFKSSAKKDPTDLNAPGKSPTVKQTTSALLPMLNKSFKKSMKKEEVELDEADQKFIDSLNKLAKTHKVGDSVTVDSKFFGKQKGKVTKVDSQSVHVVRDGKKSAEKYPHNAVVKEASDNGGTIPTPAAQTLTVNGQPKLSKTVGQTKMIPFVHEAKETKPPFDGPYTTTKAVIKDKSGAKHTPMSRARDLARKAMARNMKEQSNVTPNPFTVPEINIGKAPKKSRQMNIVREAMADAKKKKKEVTEAGTDKFITDPELASQITKS